MATTTRPSTGTRNARARELCAPRGGRARSAVGRRSSLSSSPSPDAPANALSRYRRKVSNHPLVTCDDPTGWRRGARMNLRALAAADPDTPERQRNCGAVPVGSEVEIPSVRAWAEHFPRGGSNVAIATYTGAVAQIRINALKLAEDLVTQIGAVANPTDACILMWLVTVAIHRLSHELSKDDSTLQVLIRRRTELIERLSAEIDDYSLRDSANDAQDDVDADVVQPTDNEPVRLSSIEAVLLDFSLASKDPSHPWLTFEEAVKLFGDDAAQVRLELADTRRSSRKQMAWFVAALGVTTSAVLWLTLHTQEIANAIARPATVSLFALFMLQVTRLASADESAIGDAAGVFWGTLAPLALVVAVDRCLRQPFISDVGGLIAGALIAAAAGLLWALAKRRR